MTFPPLPPLPPQASPPTQSGAFWEYSGQGISLHVDGDQWMLYWFTYGEDNKPRWYMAECTGTDESFIYATKGGSLNKYGYIETAIGDCRIYFLPDGAGVFNYHTTEHGRGSILLKKRLISQRGGVYYDPKLSGQGFSVHIYDHLKAASAYWFTYDTKGNQRWFLATGSRIDGIDDEVYNLRIYEYLDGTFGYPLEPIESEAGKALMVVTDSGIGIDYDLDAVGLKATGKYSLVGL